MEKKELIKYFLSDNKSGYKTTKRHVIKNFDGLIERIDSFIEKSEYDNSITFTQKLYNYLYDIVKIQKCENDECDNIIKWHGRFSEGYRKNCSKKCGYESKYRLKRIEKTNLDKYGEKSISRVDFIKEKKKNTNKKRFGNENLFESEVIKQKTKETNIKKYGVEFPSQSSQIRNKIISNNIKKYGVKYPSMLEENRKNNSEKYDREFHNEKIKNKFKDRGYIILDFLNDNKLKIKHPDGHIFIGDRGLLNTRFNYGIELSTKLLPIKSTISNYEIEIQKFIKTLLINCDFNNRTVLNGKELDIYFPDNCLAIEFNGLYWHSELFKDKNYHLNKTEQCEKQNIQLLHIFEDEWIYKQDIVKSIIKNKLGLNKNKIYARKCVIKEITDNHIVRDFLNKNHIQGFVGGKIKLGLFYENELVSLMTFGKKRIALGSKSISDEYELLRFCNKLNTTIIGGASKLFKHFIRNYNPNEIISFADRRYSNGNLYNQLGMKYVKKTSPNYFYVNRKTSFRNYRFKYRKDVLIRDGYDPSKTEHEIMLERGFYKIYDSGNLKFIS